MSEVFLFNVPTCKLFNVSGPDSERYLHARLTQDVKILAPSQGATSLVLSPQGKIQAKLLILRNSDSFTLIPELTNAKEAAEFIETLLQFKVADQLDVKDISNDFTIMTLQGAKSETVLRQCTDAGLPAIPFAHAAAGIYESDTRLVFHPRGTLQGFDIITKNTEKEDLKNSILGNSIVTHGSNEILEALRIKAKIPRFDTDIVGKVQASDLDLTELVSFSKGCYTGQEAIEMATARGRPNKTFMLLSSCSKTSLKPFSSFFTDPEGTNPSTSAGFVTSNCRVSDKNQTLYLAFVKTSFAKEQTFYANDTVLKNESATPIA